MSPSGRVGDIARCLSAARWATADEAGRGAGGQRGEVEIVKITADVYAFMLSYCRQGFTDVYADLRFVLSAGTHCPGNYYSVIAAALRRSRPPPPPSPPPRPAAAFRAAWPLEISNFARLPKELLVRVFPDVQLEIRRAR